MRHNALWVAAVAVLGLAATPAAWGQGSWRGLVVAPENRCAPYNSDDYGFSQTLERAAIAAMGGRIYGPYSGRTFSRPTDTDIEHIVARSEAHDSGLCAADDATKRAFANDLLNITLASPEVNRAAKNDRDAAAWIPTLNRCWFAGRVLGVRLKYGLTIDRMEATALDRILAGCNSTAMIFATAPPSPVAPRSNTPQGGREGGAALTQWDTNRNGRISCAEARAHGIAPVRRGHPAYPFMLDGDGDGVVCE